MIDFEKEFDNFVVNAGSQDPITALYALFPSMTDSQMRVYSQLHYFGEKYQSDNIRALLKNFMGLKNRNKNMDMFNASSFRRLLESYSLSEHMKGIKINSNTSEER